MGYGVSVSGLVWNVDAEDDIPIFHLHQTC